MTIDNIYRKYRKGRGFNVKEAAKLLDIAPSHLWNIENGSRKPGKKLIIKLCELYGAKLEEFFINS